MPHTPQDVHKKLLGKSGEAQAVAYLKKKGYKLGVVTSRLRFSALEVLEKFNLLSYFDIIVGLDDVVNPKPDPEGIKKASRPTCFFVIVFSSVLKIKVSQIPV